ncbi:FecR domain-containing protein [Sporosarcina sp. FSL K6-3457]|uniref:FecR domain-containing protein n=1 Tax=Sporosarcina sp. FSL K6-3457 TaxID=2978204 RepID=UPI0030FAE79A
MLKRIRITFTKSQLSLIVAIVMILSLLSPLMSQTVQAEIIRSAQIEKVIGIVHIQKAEGGKQIRAHEGMILYHGDHIQTEENSSMVFQVLDRGDIITVEENSRIAISELRNDSGKMKTSFFIWNGSIWVQASTLTNSKDEFKIETPEAFMSVRGTNLLVGVDPTTGESKFFIASGQGEVSKKGEEGSGNSISLYPNEQISLNKDTDSNDYDDYKNIADLDDLIANTSNAIIEAIIASKAAIDQENEQYIAKLKEQQDGMDEINQEMIDRIQQNLDNLIGNIVKSAIKQNKVDEAAIKAFIEQINERLDKKLDLDNVKAQELSAQEKAKQAQINLLNEERKKKQEAEKLKQEALKKQNEELKKKLNEQLEKQKEAKLKAAEAVRQRAAEELMNRLTNNAAKLAFEAKQKAIAVEKAKQDAAAKAVDTSAPVSQPSDDTGLEPVIEEPIEEEAVIEEPIEEEPVIEEPIEEEPVIEEPIEEEPVIEEPIEEEPVIEEPIEEEPVIEEPVEEEPVIEEPVEEEPIIEEPIEEEPIIEEPVEEEPIIEEPIEEEPIIEEPIEEEPIIEEPIEEEPIIEEPIDEEPIIEEPIDEEPIIEEPIEEDPVIEEPVEDGPDGEDLTLP